MIEKFIRWIIYHQNANELVSDAIGACFLFLLAYLLLEAFP
jgi:hypothetical protein